MKKVTIIAALLCGSIALLGTSCATIFTRSSYPIVFTTNPAGANIRIVNRDRQIVYSGTTPSVVRLKSAAGYMKREEYSVTFECPGHAPQTFSVLCNLDGWYFGNLLLGGFLGMLIIDPASGAMYRIPDKYIHAELYPSTYASRELQILDINQVPEGVELVQINQ